MTWDELVRSLATSVKADWRATVHTLLVGLPASRNALLEGLLDERPLVRAGCAAALDHADQDDVVEEALRHAGKDRDARVRHMALHGRTSAITAAFARILAEDTDQKLRHRAATYLASNGLPREGRHYGEWVNEWSGRITELEAK